MGTLPEEIASYRRLMMAHGEMGPAVSKRDGSARALAQEIHQIEQSLLFPSNEGQQFGGLYLGMEDLCAFYMHGEHLPWPFFMCGIEFLADQLATVSFPAIRRFRDVPERYGPELAGAVCDFLANAMRDMRIEYRRFETEVEDEASGEWITKYGPLDSTDEDLIEAGMPICEAGDEGATQLTIVHFDPSDWAGIYHAFEGRETAARQARASIQPDEKGLSWVDQQQQQQQVSTRCTEIADQVVPKYRNVDGPTYPCHGTVAKRWQAAWDGACIALGLDPETFRT